MIKELEKIIGERKFQHWKKLGGDNEPIHDKEWYNCLCWVTKHIERLKKKEVKK